MARIPIIMPKMSMTMTEGEVATWLVKVGDQVNEGDVIAEVMTDKVDMEVESTHTGTLVEITVEDGMVAVGEPIGYLEGEESGLGDLFGTDDEAPAPRSRRPRTPRRHGCRTTRRCRGVRASPSRHPDRSLQCPGRAAWPASTVSTSRRSRGAAPRA